MNKGTRFYKCDFQVHTPRDINWSGNKPVSYEDRNEYAQKFVLDCRVKGVNAVAITDHHDLTFFPFIKSAAKSEFDESGNLIDESKQLVVFPGIELTLSNPPIQVLLILDSNFQEDQLIRVLHKLALEPNPAEEASTIETAPIPSDVVNGLTDLHIKLDAIEILKGKYIVLPHLSNGHKGLLRRDFYEHYNKMPCVGGYVDGSVPDKEGVKNILNGKDRNYGFKSIAVFQTSDNRKETFDDLGTHTTWVKWATPTAEALRQACLAKESRISQIEPELPQVHIQKISVTNSKFLGRIELEFNQQYNAFIGGRGTGKSTILEYLRWGLCDQIIGTSEVEDVQSEILKRRLVLIEKTLIPYSGEVRISTVVNGIEHIVKRNSFTKEIQLKIGSGSFEKASEEEIRRLIPVQAYSQKQLSSVGVRTEELKRFIEQPIANDLSDIRFNLREISKNVKLTYNNFVRKKELQGEVEELQLQHKSIKEQVENLRQSLKGISDEDKKVIAEKQLFENEQTFIQGTQNEFELFKEKTIDLLSSFKGYPNKLEEDAELINIELLKQIEEEKLGRFLEIKNNIQEVVKLFDEEKLGELNNLVKKWQLLKNEFEKILLIYMEKLIGGISVSNIFNISEEVKNSFQITEGIKHTLCVVAQCIRGSERRLFMATTVEALGRGGQRMVEKELKWNRQTIRKGMHELQSGFVCIDYFSGRGRKPMENQLPNLHDDITDIVKPKTLADPTFRTTKLYTTLTATTVHKCLIDEKGYTEKQLPSVRTISTKLNYLNFNPQRVAKSKPIKRIKETEEIFQQVYKINRVADKMNGILRLSLDAKAKIDIGPFSRKGRSRQGVKGSDHDFKPEHILYLFGIFLPCYNQSYFYFTEASITADFIVDCLEMLWPIIKTIYNPHTLVLNVDNGPENSSRRTQFIKRVVDFAYNNYINIKLAYYPPYHSKYNPIERVWGVLERRWNGEILYSMDKALGLARSMTYNGVNPKVEMIEEKYQKGITLDKKEMAIYEEKLIRLKGLEKWFVDIIVRSDYHFDSLTNLAS